VVYHKNTAWVISDINNHIYSKLDDKPINSKSNLYWVNVLTNNNGGDTIDGFWAVF